MMGQGTEPANPMGFKTIFPRIGFEGGIDISIQDGSYVVGCGEFTEGWKPNLTLAAAYDYPVSDKIKIEGLLGFRQRNVNDSYETVEPSIIRTADGFVERDITYQNNGEARFSYLFLQPSVRYHPILNLFVGVGVNMGVTLSSTTTYTKGIDTKVVTLDDGSLMEIYYTSDDANNPHLRVFPSESPENVSAFLIDPVIYTGLELRAGDFWIYPRLTYSIPLIAAVSDPELKFRSIQATVGIRYYLR